MRYVVVIERAAGNFSAYVPDLPGCIATGSTRTIAEKRIREAIRFHFDGLREDGRPIPDPCSIAKVVSPSAGVKSLPPKPTGRKFPASVNKSPARTRKVRTHA